MLFSYFEETHIDEGFEKDLTFHFVHSDRQLDSDAILTYDFDDLCFIF